MKFVALNSDVIIEVTKVMAIKGTSASSSEVLFVGGSVVKVWMSASDVLGIINAALGMSVKSSPHAK
jgi:hypothetical protein